MKKNKRLIPVFIVLALGAITFWLVVNKGKNNGTLDVHQMDFAVKDTASITKIHMADKTGKSITLTRASAGTWIVNDKFNARPDAIKILLNTMASVAVQSPVSVKAKDNIIKWMATGATLVEAYAGDQRIKMYYVGGETQDQLGTYMLLADPETGEKAESPFIMEIPGFNGYLSTRYFTEEAEWRDRTVFRNSPMQIRSIRVEHNGYPEAGFQIDLQDAYHFTLKSLSGASLPFDTVKMKQYISYYGNVGFEVIENKIAAAKKDSVIRTTPVHIITLTDTKGKVSRIKMFLKQGDAEKIDSLLKINIDADRMYGLINDDKDFVLVQYYVFGKLLQSPAYFLPDQPGQKKPNVAPSNLQAAPALPSAPGKKK